MNRSEYIHDLTSEAVKLLKGMIAIPSPSFSEDEVCTYISGWLDSKGIRHERAGRNIIAEHITDPAGPTLMLCAHIDTVAPCEGYSFDPYTPDYKDAAKAVSETSGRICTPEDIVAGLGSNDDGASAVAMIAAYRHFCCVHPSCCGGNGMQDRATPLAAGEGAHDDGVGVVVAHSITPAAGHNLTLVLSCEEERSGKDGMTGLWPSRLNRIGYAIVGEPTGMKVATSERGLLVIDATAHGTSGHAARNEGKNALYIAIEDIERIRRHRFVKESPLMGNVNVNITQINAGTAHNVIPDRCDFVIDIRPTEQYTNEEILEELQSICESELKPRNLSNRSSATQEGSPLLAAAKATGLETFSSPTTSDWMRITCDAVKMGPGESSRSHRKNEYVLVAEISNAIETYIDFIDNFMSSLTKEQQS